MPVFYFSNPTAIYGPEDEIPYPEGTQELDYELECAAVIGADGAIGGFTVMNDWSARDLQRQEMRVGLGPAKGKDFATSLGPVLVTPDEFDGSAGAMVARVNGEERSRGELGAMYHHWDALVARAAPEHGAPARGRDRLGHGRDRLHPRARRRPLAAARVTSSSSRSKASACCATRGRDDRPRRRPRGRAPARRRRAPHARRPLAHARRARRAQAREPAAWRRVQVPRRVQHDLVARRGGGGRRVLVRQPRAGGGVSPSRLPGCARDHRDAEDAPQRRSTQREATAPRSSRTTATPRIAWRSARRSRRSAVATLVPPLRRPAVMAGAGTAALELIEDAGPLDTLVTPVGGGGLIVGQRDDREGPRRRTRRRRRARGGERQAALARRRRARRDRRAAHDRRRACRRTCPGELHLRGRLAARRRDRHRHRRGDRRGDAVRVRAAEARARAERRRRHRGAC